MSTSPESDSAEPAEAAAPVSSRPDPHAARRQNITEEDGTHKAWMEEAHGIKTIEEFAAFHDKLMNTYNHDYGTICHALAALGVAGACLANHDPINGYITGFQAQAVMWEWLAGWGTGPKRHGRMLDFDHMLYPQYEYKFKTISAAVWEKLQASAKEYLEKETATDSVRAHWQSIADGVVPFGYSIPPEGANA
jgi:hypothetical protein